MEIKISDQAAAWYEREMHIKEGGFVRFFARYGGSSPIQQGFSLGLSLEEPESDIGAESKKNGITYYILEKDLWYFDGHDLQAEFNENAGEPDYQYSK
jgi:uncharacterized protein YneR